MKKDAELCIKDKNNRIVGWVVGYSDTELRRALKVHEDDGWHIDYAEDRGYGYK